jgi:hypothetical protein
MANVTLGRPCWILLANEIGDDAPHNKNCKTGWTMRRIAVWCMLLIVVALMTVTGCVTEPPARRVVVEQPPGEFIVQETPPPLRQEVIEVAPSPMHVWLPGHWAWHGGWIWVPGHWRVAPYQGAVWVPGHWARRGPGWVWISGTLEAHSLAPPGSLAKMLLSGDSHTHIPSGRVAVQKPT